MNTICYNCQNHTNSNMDSMFSFHCDGIKMNDSILAGIHFLLCLLLLCLCLLNSEAIVI